MYQKLNILNAFLIFLGFTILLSGCSQGRTENTQTEKRIYEEQVNEVDISILKRIVFEKEIISNGKLKALKKSDLKFKVPGELKELMLKNGHSVAAGQAIAILDQFEYRQKLEHAETTVKKTAIDLEDALLAYGGSQRKESIPEAICEGAAIRSGYVAALNDLKTARFNLGETILKAPFSGKIANLKQNVYELVDPGEVFCTLIDDSAFEVEFHLIESEIGEVALNDKVKIIPFSNSVTCSGVVSEINPLVDENGLVLVKATVRNDEGVLWEGMNVRVLIEKQVPGHLVVPKAAVVLRQNQEVLFKYMNGSAFWTYVQTSLENSTSYAVIAHPDKGGTLQEGDTIITSNNLNLAHESEVTIK